MSAGGGREGCNPKNAPLDLGGVTPMLLHSPAFGGGFTCGSFWGDKEVLRPPPKTAAEARRGGPHPQLQPCRCFKTRQK